MSAQVFWPGSHRHPECVHLGSAAANTLGAVVSGAPLAAGSALCYDYRLVHCAAPNDWLGDADSAASGGGGEGVVPGGERPILQLVYTVKGYDDAGSNYGFFQLFPD